MSKQRAKLVRARAALQVVDPEAFKRAQFAQPELRAIAIRIEGLRRDGNRQLVDIVLDVGECLQRARPLLRARGLYNLWVKEVLRSDPRTASNQVNLAKLAALEPRFVEDWKALGLAKLYRLAALGPAARQTVLRADHLEEMNDREFDRLLRPHQPSRKRKVTPRMKAHGARMKLNAWTQQVKALPTPRLSPTDRAALRADYQRLVDALETKIRALK